jgi:hypothetical protein
MPAAMSTSADPRARAPRVAWAAAVLALAIFSLLIGWSGIRAYTPEKLNADEHVFVEQLDLMRRGGPAIELDPHFGYYPQFVPRLCYLLWPVAPSGEPASLAEHRVRSTESLVVARSVVALIASSIVVGTYLLARRFLDRPQSLLAAGLLAMSLLHQWYATQARPHEVEAAAALFAILAMIGVWRRGRAVDWILSGLAIGCAVGTLQNGFLLLLPLAVAHVARRREGSAHPHVWLAVSLVIVAASVRAFYPFVFAEAPVQGGKIVAEGTPDEAYPGHHLLGQANVGIGTFDGSGFATLLEPMVDFDPWILAWSTAGLVIALAALIALARRARSAESAAVRARPVPEARTRARSFATRIGAFLREHGDVAIILAYVVPYLIVFGLYRKTYPRYVIPLLPYIVCLASFGAGRFAELAARCVRSQRARAALATSLLLLVCLVQAAAACEVTAARGAEDTACAAARWIETRLDPARDRIAVVPSLELPLLRDDESLLDSPRDLEGTLDPWIVYQTKLMGTPRHAPTWSIRTLRFLPPAAGRALADDPASALRAFGAEYVAVENHRRPLYDRFLANVRASCRLVARISPASTDPIETIESGDMAPDTLESERLRDVHFLSMDEVHWHDAYAGLLRTALRVRRLGAAIEIYRLR